MFRLLACKSEHAKAGKWDGETAGHIIFAAQGCFSCHTRGGPVKGGRGWGREILRFWEPLRWGRAWGGLGGKNDIREGETSQENFSGGTGICTHAFLRGDEAVRARNKALVLCEKGSSSFGEHTWTFFVDRM